MTTRPDAREPTRSAATSHPVAPTVSVELLRDLATWHQPPCVSIYSPVRSDPPDPETDRLTLRSTVRHVAHQLELQTSLDGPAIERILAPAETVIDTRRPDRSRHGYALFGAPGLWCHAELGVDIPVMSSVADRFVITPLVAALEYDDRHFVLAVSQNQVRFFGGGRDGLVDVAVPDLPANRAEALWYEDNERTINVHGGSQLGSGQIVGTLHGSPSDRDLRKHQLLRFFRVIDKALWRVLHAESAPLLLAGVGYELAIYREANRYPHLAGVVETGNPERLDAAQLHHATWPTAAIALDSTRQELIARAASSPEQLTTVATILAACNAGRVHALLVRPDTLLWGRDGDDLGHLDQREGDIELTSMVIGAALEQGAAVYPLARGELPYDPPVAAVSRF